MHPHGNHRLGGDIVNGPPDKSVLFLVRVARIG